MIGEEYETRFDGECLGSTYDEEYGIEANEYRD